MCIARRITVHGAFAYITSRIEWMTSSPPVPRIAAPRMAPVSASTAIFMNPWVSPFSTARPTRVIGRLAMSALRPLLRISPSVIPTRLSGGSMYSAYAVIRSLTRRGSFSSTFATTISASL